MAAPRNICLHCILLGAIQEVADAATGPLPMSAIVEALGSVVGELAARAPTAEERETIVAATKEEIDRWTAHYADLGAIRLPTGETRH